MLMPDHWVPSSLISWQRGWRGGSTLAFVAALTVLHVLAGAAIFFIYLKLAQLCLESPGDLLAWAFFFAAPFSLLRVIRYPSISTVLQLCRSGVRPWARILSLIGVCEFVMPLMMKGRLLGIGYALPLGYFLLGSLLCAALAVPLGRRLWNRPLWMTEWLGQLQSRAAAVPMFAGLLVGFFFTLR